METKILSCALDRVGLEEQRRRHRRLSPSVVQVTRQATVLGVDFAPGFDRRALDELIAVERECCPFFAFSFDERLRHLEIAVRDPDAAPALDAFADELSVTIS